MSIPRPRISRRLGALVASGALAAGVLAAVASPVAAAPATTTSPDTPVSGATLTWGLNGEQGGGAFFGGCNFLSAGTAGNTGSSRLWTEADGFYKTTDGNVTVEKPNLADEYSQPSWSTKCQTPAGTPVTAASTTSLSKNRVKITNGSGSVDESGAATIQWYGSFTSVFYGGLTYWSASNPRLVVDAAGNGTLTATASGYGADMDDTSKWVTLAPRTITLANLKNVQVDADGFTSTPDYLGVEVNTPASGTPQTRSGANWGAFPQSFVDFQVLTGQSSYWYSSGGSRDAAKPTTPLQVGGYTLGSKPSVTVDDVDHYADGSATVTVSGQNFNPAAAVGLRPPLAGKEAGAYVVFGKFASSWRPSLNAPSANRKVVAQKWAVPAASTATIGGPAAGAVELAPDGTFTTELTISKTAADAVTADTSLRYGVYTYAGSGAYSGAYETYTPITFTTRATSTTSSDLPTGAELGTELSTDVTVSSDGGTPTGSVTASEGDDELVTGDLDDGTATLDLSGLPLGTHEIVFRYSGSDTTQPSSVTKTIEIGKSASTVEVGATPSWWYFGQAPKIPVTVTGGDDTPTGTVTARIRDVVIGTGTLDADGATSVTLKNNLTPGSKRDMTFTYDGDDATASSEATVQRTISKSAVKWVVSNQKTPTTKTTGRLGLWLGGANGGPRPAGVVRFTFVKGSAKKYVAVRTTGVSTVTVPKLSKGTWRVVGQYYGSANHWTSGPGTFNTLKVVR